MTKALILILAAASIAFAGDGGVELRFDHTEVITGRMEIACMVLTNLSTETIQYTGSIIGKHGWQFGHLTQRRVNDRWEDIQSFVCRHELERRTLAPGESAQFVFPPTSPPAEWRAGVRVGESNVIWSASLPPMRTDLKEPNHAVERTGLAPRHAP